MSKQTHEKTQNAITPLTNTKEAVESKPTGQLTMAAFSGPLPPPAILAQYNEIIENGAERILHMAEKQSAHREEMEKRVVRGNVLNQTLGTIFAFVIVMTGFACGTWLIYLNKSAAGLGTILTPLCGICGVFFYSKNAQRKERESKAKSLEARSKS